MAEESYWRTNEPSPLEVEPSTAGASGGRDHGRKYRLKRWTTSIVAANAYPCELIAPGIAWKYRDLHVRPDGCLIVVWERNDDVISAHF